MSNINKTILSNVCLSYNQPHLKELFSDNTINKLSLIITQKIKDQIKKNIQVTNNIISDTLTTLYKYESEQFLMRFPGRENTLTTGNHRFEELLQKTINIQRPWNREKISLMITPKIIKKLWVNV